MVRNIVGLLTLLFLAGLVLAAQDTKSPKKDAKKPDYTRVIGTFVSYKDEILTLKIDDKEEKQFKVPGDTPVGYGTAKKDSETKILKAKEHLKDVEKGTYVSVTLDGKSKKVLAIGVIVSELPKGKSKDKDEKKD